MTYKNAIDKIIERFKMEGQAFGSSVARNYFYQAMVALSDKPEFTQNDLRDYFLRISYTIPEGTTTSINYSTLNTAISGANCIDKVVDIIGLSTATSYNKYAMEEVKTWSYSANLKPDGAFEVGWYQIGDKIYFEPRLYPPGGGLLFIIKLKTRIYASSGSTTATPGAVGRTLLDADELNGLYSEQFVIACIEKAVELLKKSVEYNR